MEHSQIFNSESERRGRGIYDTQIRSIVETKENIGRLCAINVETGEYVIGDEILTAAASLRAKCPDGIVWIERIGYNAVFTADWFLDNHPAVPLTREEREEFDFWDRLSDHSWKMIDDLERVSERD